MSVPAPSEKYSPLIEPYPEASPKFGSCLATAPGTSIRTGMSCLDTRIVVSYLITVSLPPNHALARMERESIDIHRLSGRTCGAIGPDSGVGKTESLSSHNQVTRVPISVTSLELLQLADLCKEGCKRWACVVLRSSGVREWIQAIFCSTRHTCRCETARDA